MKIKFSLSPSSIDAAIKQLEDYRNGLPAKAEQIRKIVSEELEKLVKEGFNGAPYDDVIYRGFKVPDVSVTVEENGNITLVVAHGKEAVFIEFGAGVYYNPGGGPARPPDIVSIGEYGKGYGKREIWGYYEGGKTDDPEENKKRLRLTHGTPASMPMFYAAKEIAARIPAIARAVFKGGDTS